MAGILITSAVVIFVLGFTLGVIALASLAIHREERTFLSTGRVSITQRTADRTSLAGRGVTGLWVRHWDEERPLSAGERVAAHYHQGATLPGPQDTTSY